MRRIELLLKTQSDRRRRHRLPRRTGASHALWLALLAVLAVLYARNQSGVPAEPEPVAAAPAAQPPATPVTAVEPAAQPVPIPAAAASRPSPVPVIPARRSPATPAPAPAVATVPVRGMLAADPPALVFDSRLVRSGSAERNDSEHRSEGQVEIRRKSRVTSEIEIASETKSITITNTGTAPVKVGSVGLARIEFDVFFLAGDSCSGNVLTPGAACRILIRFLAAETGAYASQLSIPSDAVPLTLPVTATVAIVDQPSRK